MKNVGKVFEEDFANSFSTEDFVYRLRDSAGSWSSDDNLHDSTKNNKVRFTVKNVCDFVAYSNRYNKFFLLELKSVGGKSLPLSNIKPHQLKSLYEYGNIPGVNALFIINFRSVNESYALKADVVYEYFEMGLRKSVPLDMCRQGGIFLPSKLLRTRYRYDVSGLMA